jgi:hypothetical protein
MTARRAVTNDLDKGYRDFSNIILIYGKLNFIYFFILVLTYDELSAVLNGIISIIFSGSAAQRGLWPPRPRGFLITRNDATQSAALLWASDQLVAETST